MPRFHRHARVLLPALLCVGARLALPLGAAASGPPEPSTLRAWVAEFERSPKGPFESIRWFCNDGVVLPPKPYACSAHGGGLQHGSWSARAVAMRDAGFAIANLLAALQPERFVGDDPALEELKQILIERFLIGWDDGWIFRGARSYRGAIQIEDEEAGARRLVLAMLADPAWRAPARFALLREAVRLLPLQADRGSAAEVRRLAIAIAEKDAGFASLRAKIHGVPDAGDAARVRAYAGSRGAAELAAEYQELAGKIDRLYAPAGAAEAAAALATEIGDSSLAAALRKTAAASRAGADPAARLAAASRALARIRERFPEIQPPQTALSALQTSLVLEDQVYATGNSILVRLGGASRRERLALLRTTAEALYGAGFLGRRHRAGLEASVARLEAAETPSVNRYREELRYLARAPEWSRRWLEFHFGPELDRFARIEPAARLYPQDRLRGSPLLFYGAVLDGLVRDAQRLAGVEHELLGRRVGTGVRALNPGLARGVLRAAEGPRSGSRFERNGIYILPETTSDLPPVAGILTRGEGSSLSHVQLLARNLGIPNVVVGEDLLGRLRSRLGSRVVLAVSPNGVVQLAEDGPRWEAIFGRERPPSGAVIRPDLDKLDLESTGFLPLSSLRASDSGRTSGPKGANLGELAHAFGDAVPEGFVIPFGAFRRLLEQPLEPGGPSVFEWMKERYAALASVEGEGAAQRRRVSDLLTRLRGWIETADPGPRFRAQLRSMLRKSFGEDGTYGVFVRSDTNVEDLPGFTGAGLNLTVPNVVGTDEILEAIRAVWASPFTERAYGWRQAHMENPAYVFPAVVVQLGVAAEKSGVMVTADLERGESGWISVAVNEGVGGAVEGQAAESLRIREDTGEVRFLAQASAPRRAVLSPSGGIAHLPASGTEAVLDRSEIAQLVALAKQVRERFRSLRGADGGAAAADIEFAFRDGKLALLQIRPFVESRRAQGSAYLSRLDAGLRKRGGRPVPLSGIPEPPLRGAVTAPRGERPAGAVPPPAAS